MCMRQQPAPLEATTPAIAGSWRKADTSLTMVAPACRAVSATATLRVSMEMVAGESLSMTGTTRRSSSSSETGSAPGRVDSPPTSRTPAPSLSRCSPCATAASAEKYNPPSEKESGVTFTTPITRGSMRGRLLAEELQLGAGGAHRAKAVVCARGRPALLDDPRELHPDPRGLARGDDELAAADDLAAGEEPQGSGAGALWLRQDSSPGHGRRGGELAHPGRRGGLRC